jgi:hypothetical protein
MVYIHQFENFLVISFVFSKKIWKILHCPPVTKKDSCIASARTRKSHLQSIQTHELQEILEGIYRYLQRLGDIHPDSESTSSIRRGVNAVLQPYYHDLQEWRCQARQKPVLSYFKKKSQGPPTDPKTAENDPVDPDDPQ